MCRIESRNIQTMSAEEATINPDGTQTMGEDAAADAGADYADAGAGADDADDADAGEEDFGEGAEEAAEEVIKGTDPAIFLLLGFALIAGLWFVSWYKKKKEDEESDSFFTELDGEKVSCGYARIGSDCCWFQEGLFGLEDSSTSCVALCDGSD